MRKESDTFQDLLEITRRLCAPDGCPWDSTQTHQTLRRYAVEEAYELVDAIEQDDPAKIADESGDVLFQVALHAAIAEKLGEYDISDVTTAICQKMRRRHPALFGGEDKDWDTIKREERQQTGLLEELRGIAPALPALMRAEKIQKKLKKANRTPTPLPERADAELQYGHRLFTLVQTCSGAGISPELALNRYLKHLLAALESEENVKGESLCD